MTQTAPHSPRIAVIGLGAMSRSLAGSLPRGAEGLRVGAALVRPGSGAEAEAAAQAAGLTLFRDAADLLAWAPDLVVECAGHGAVRDLAPGLLAAGVPVVVVSIGALGDADLRGRLEAAAAGPGGGRLTVASGAIGGLDILRTGGRAGLSRVVYRGVKPPAAWKGSPAEDAVDLDALTEPTVFFEGDAAEASARFPKNANVTAAVALAGIGFAGTRVSLIADPTAAGNRHEIEGEGAFGSFQVALSNVPLPDNPKTSWLAALSVEEAVVRHFQSVSY
ncbi:MAG: aspartate dehydrogenase [Rhodobacteraceae bacterium]|nr:aspartate dehydrogenase [Paracoccaceae bacterium]